MTVQNKTTIKSYFETGDRPTQAQFIDFIDSYQDVLSATNPVTNALLNQMAANTLKGNITAVSATPTDVAVTANQFLARSSTGNIAAKTITDFGLSLVDDATAGAALTTLGVVSANAKDGIPAGTSYTLTNTAAKVVFGTSQATVTLDSAGTYLIIGTARVEFNGATVPAGRIVTLALWRSNNTPALLTNARQFIVTPAVTTVSYTAGTLTFFALYSTGVATDTIDIFADIDVLPSAGSIQVAAPGTSIKAIRLQS